MTDLRNQRRMAASLLKCGVNRVWMDHDRVDEIAKAVTKEDVRVLIKGKAIKDTQPKISGNIISKINVILNKFQDFELRLSRLENTVYKIESEEINII